MKRFLGTLWTWSWLVTLPIVALFAYWALGTWRQFKAFAIDYDASPVEVTLRGTGIETAQRLQHQARVALTGGRLTDIPENLQLRTIQLRVPDRELAKLNRDLPYSGYQDVEGELMYPEGLKKVDVRYRGDFLVHWGYEKKSIRVVTGTDDLFEGLRKFNLIVAKFPEQLNNYLGYRLAAILGLISPRCELVNVVMNGKNLGVHEFTEQLEEGTLRAWDRMAGDMYSGDLISKDQWLGCTNRVFELPELWTKIAANNHFELTSKAPLEHLLRLLNDTPNEQNHAELSRLLDMQAWGTFAAFELINQTHHYDEAHNWRLNWDGWRLKFVPVIWDPIGWAPEMRPPGNAPIAHDLVISRLHQWLLGNGDFLAARQAAIEDFFRSGKAEKFQAEVAWAMAAARAALARDPNMRPADPVRVDRAITAMGEFIDRVLRELRLAWLEKSGDVQWADLGRSEGQPWTLRCQVTGRRPVHSLALRFDRPLASPPRAALRYTRFGKPHEIDLTGAVTLQGNVVRVDARMFTQLAPTFQFMPNRVLRQHTRIEWPGIYDLVLDGIPADNRLMHVGAARDGGRPEAFEPATPAGGLPPPELEFVYRPSPPRPLIVPQHWQGEVEIPTSREIFDEIVIAAGTTIRMGPGAHLIFRRRVTAEGTEQAPIRFIPARDGQDPWGTLAINHPDCSGSTLRWCEVRGGSGWGWPKPGWVPMEEYCSMFSVHNCKDIRIEHCTFADNHLYDDMIHVMYAEVILDDIRLLNARMDALDCDISKVVLRNSRFIKSGNDGVDLMTTTAIVHDCVFEKNGDKGISIGEGTHLIAGRNVFDGCVKAMEAKDSSIAHVFNCEIVNCNRAFNSYKKNWRYDAGGNIFVYKSFLAKNREMPTADQWSRAELIDCAVEKGAEIAPMCDMSYVDGTTVRMVNHARMIDCNGGRGPKHRRPFPFPSTLQHMEGMARGLWDSLRIDFRGVPR